MIYRQNIYNLESDSKSVTSEILSIRDTIIEQKTLNEFPLLNILYNDRDLDDIEEVVANISIDFENLVIIGMGGASLSSKAILDLNIYINKYKILYLDNIDPITIKRFCNLIDFKRSLFIVISKSGRTYETIALFGIILQKIREKHINYEFEKYFYIITNENDNPIRQIANSIRANILNHDDIGGRFSLFTNVGLLPARICGLDIKKIREGAKYILEDFLNYNNSAIIKTSAAILINRYNINNLVSMPYSDRLVGFNQLYRQIWAESTGKKGFGIAPITAIGTIDQHSQLQLYLEGPKDKIFTIITTRNQDDFKIKLPIDNILNGKTLDDLIKAEENSTISSLIGKKCPIILIELSDINEFTIGGLILKIMLETILVAKTLNINPFDQPSVENNKILIEKNLL